MSRSIAALSARTSVTDGAGIVETKRSLPDRAESSSRAEEFRLGDDAEADATRPQQALGTRIDGIEEGHWSEPGSGFMS
jgi:hypothetical protein